MTTIGIICEYNPFHNGHLYHINKIKEMYTDSLIILVLNGYFLERGEISIINKSDKAKIALQYGVDIVLELPFVFGTQSADTFASASIKMLEEYHCDYVVFGSESNDLNALNKIIDYTITNETKYNKDVKKYLNQGANYPTSLAKSLNSDFNFNSNDLLAISYIKAIKLNHYHIKPITIKRTNNYLDIDSNDYIISASNIRNKILNNEKIDKYIPNYNKEYIKNIDFDKLFELLKYKILTSKDLSIYLDVDEGIEFRLKKVINNCQNINNLIENIKSKRYTYNKIRRMLIHILIGYTKEDNKSINLDYIKVLGFNNTGKKYLNSIKKELNYSTTALKNSLVYHYELLASSIYDLITNDNTLEFEHENKPFYGKNY